MPSGGLRDLRTRIRRFVARIMPGRSTPAIVSALDGMSHGLCIYDADDRLVFANEGFGRIYRQSAQQISPGISFYDVLVSSVAVGNYPGRSAQDLWRERKAFVDRREPGTFLQTLGDGRLIAISHRPLDTGGWVAVYEDVTERRRAETRLQFMAHHDPLTALPNRHLFAERLDEAITRLAAGERVALLCLDLDGFKLVNDRLGHGAGDELLRLVAGRLQEAIRKDDVAARLGGDEFAILLPDTDAQTSAGTAVRIGRLLSQPYGLTDEPCVRVGVSVGMACAPDHASNARDLLSHADDALYEAKRRRQEPFRVHDGQTVWPRKAEPAAFAVRAAS